MKWDSWVGHGPNGPVVMQIKTLFTVHILRKDGTVDEWKVQLHRMINTDKPGCWHTHPARAFRFVLWGGYIEEVIRSGKPLSRWIKCRPGFSGWVTPDHTHRIAALYGKTSWSLWIRGPITHEVQLVGWGW